MFSANPLPRTIAFATVVPFGDSFLLVGGQEDAYSETYLSTVYLYNPDKDSWTLLSAKMSEAKRNVIAMMADRNVFESE